MVTLAGVTQIPPEGIMFSITEGNPLRQIYPKAENDSNITNFGI